MSAAQSLLLQIKPAARRTVVVGLNSGLSVEWNSKFINTLAESYLEIKVWQGHPPMPDGWQIDVPQVLSAKRFHFDLSPSKETCWVSTSQSDKLLSTVQLSEYILKKYLDKAEAVKQ